MMNGWKNETRLELLEHLAEGEEGVKNGRIAPVQDTFDELRAKQKKETSVCGHTITDTIRRWVGEENRPKNPEVWVNKKGNVYMMDCGCGMYDRCKLSCLCLETKEIYYVSNN